MRRHLLDSDLQQLGVWQLTILESRISARPLTAKHRPLRQADTDLIYERDTPDPPAFGIPLMKGD